LNSVVLALIVFLCTAGAALVGIVLHTKLPTHHLDSDSKDVVKLVMGLIATMAALVLSLLIASAQASHSSQNDELRGIAAKIVELDRLLALYGPETADSRDLMRQTFVAANDRIWLRAGVNLQAVDPLNARAETMKFYAMLSGLSPKTDVQRFLLGRVFQASDEIAQTRLLLFARGGGSISLPFLFILVFWLAILFLGFGLFARLQATIIVALLVGALSVSAAIFLIVELSDPYGGLIRLSDAPIARALAQIGSPVKP
jgi:hypothetical protein